MVDWQAVYYVWLRNFNVWKKLAFASLLGNVVDPVMALIAFGLGLGSMVAGVDDQPYINFLAVGAVSIGAMNAATFEAMYSAFSRMHAQRTWEAIMNTPVRLHEVVLGEWIWAASKSVLSACCMMVVVAALGIGDFWFWALGLGVLVVAGLMFSGMALCVNAKAPGYDFFVFYFTLAVTPMTFLSGAFFPREHLPAWLASVSAWLPLSVVVDMLRALYAGAWSQLLPEGLLLVMYTLCAIALAVYWTQQRYSRQV